LPQPPQLLMSLYVATHVPLQHSYPAAVQFVQTPPLLELDDDPLALPLDEADDDVLLLEAAVVLPLLDAGVPPKNPGGPPPPDDVDACSPLDDEPGAPPLAALGALEPQAVAPRTTEHAQTAVAAPVSHALSLDGAVAT
jgi:hypothetical protein